MNKLDGYTFRLKTFRVTEPAPPAKVAADSPQRAFNYLRSIFEQEDLDLNREHFVVLALNTRCYGTGFKVVSSGTLTECLISPREVFRAAIVLNAAQIIVAHNHPSGDATPSASDAEVTRELRQCGEHMGIPVLDHLVLAKANGVWTYEVCYGHRHGVRSSVRDDPAVPSLRLSGGRWPNGVRALRGSGGLMGAAAYNRGSRVWALTFRRFNA